jgi:hypothetical protein
LQPGLEDAFAAAVEVVAVDEGEHDGAEYCTDKQYIKAKACWSR